jgi:hypothetical protein
MILDTFTYSELYSTMSQAYHLMLERNHSYLSHNFSKIRKLCKKGDYFRPFYAEIENQRYSMIACYRANKDDVYIGVRALRTIILNGNRKLVLEFRTKEAYGEHPSFILTVYTEHFLNRYCERSGINDTDMSLFDKAVLFYDNTDLRIAHSKEDELINRLKEPSLPVNFLPKTNIRKDCACFKNGDIAIVEMYDFIPVWRTYITKEMLYDRQTQDASYIEKVEKSIEIQDTEDDKEWVPKDCNIQRIIYRK